MAQKKSKEVPVTSSVSQPSASEIRNWYEKNKRTIENYENALEGVKQLRDVTKTSTKTITAFSKETLRSYLQNIGSNEKNLRNLSRYLYYRSQVYYRLIMYNANMFCLDARAVIPTYDITKNNDKTKILKQYYNTLKELDSMSLQYELFKAYVICFREDVFYGCCYKDDTGMFILPLDPDYCKISGQYQTGDFSFHMDMTYFRNRQEVLEYLGEPFQNMYSDYESSNIKWQPMPDEYAICLKARAEDWDLVLPVYSGLFNDLISLLDLSDIQAIADEQQIYKMIWLKMKTISGSKDVDDWEVSPDIMVEYFNRMVGDAIPDYVTAAIVPGELDTISFDNDQASDINKVEKATESVLNTSGGAQILNSATISGTTAFNASIKSDTEFAISMLLPQTEAWVNRFLGHRLSNPAKVKFFEVSAYTKDEFKKTLLNDAQYGLTSMLTINALNGYSELDTLSLNFLENECLDLHNKFIPVASTHTQPGSAITERGAPKKDDVEISDDGEASRDKVDKSNG